MKKNNLLFILSLIFICTGCSVEYNIDINEYSYGEEIYIIEKIDDYYKKGLTADEALQYNKQMINMELDQPTEIEYYDLSSYFNLYEIGAKLFNKKRTFNEFILPFYKCYESYNFSNEKGIITLETKGNFLCSEYLQYTDDIKINIYTDFELIETNANKVENGKYVWNLKENTDKNLVLKLSVSKDNSIIKEKRDYVDWNIITIAIISIIVLILVIFSYIAYINRKSNKI